MNKHLFLKPEHFPNYELIDCGNFKKLERFGDYITIRPEPQALWSPVMNDKEWDKLAHVVFQQKNSSSGIWKKLKAMPDQWRVAYKLNNKEIVFRLGLTSFKHVGIFPEQASNWEYIFNSIQKLNVNNCRVLNLFAYTGGASLAAKLSGANVTHVDSIKQVITWANENQKLSHLNDIKWVIEDALKFVKREVKRGNTYNGIILDPPAYGHGPDGEKWKLEDQLNEMMENVLQLLSSENNFLILNAYSLGLSAMVTGNILKPYAGDSLETGELFLESKTGLQLPLGIFGRFCNKAN